MKKITIIISAVLLAVGLTLFTSAFAAAGFDFSKLSTASCDTAEHKISASFERIRIDTAESDIVFKSADDGQCRVECYERDKMKHSVLVEDGTLTITCTDRRSWYDYLTFSAGSPSMTVYLPAKDYEALSIDCGTGDITVPDSFSFGRIDVSTSTGDVDCAASASGNLKIRTGTGSIRLSGVKAESIDLSASTGNIELKDAETKTGITIETSTGDVTLTNTVACGALTVETSTGDVRFENSDAARITVETSTGDVIGTLLTPKIFAAKTSTGSVRLPEIRMGGLCEITTSTGDIDIAVLTRQ